MMLVIIFFQNICDGNEFIGANNNLIDLKTPKETIIHHKNQNENNHATAQISLTKSRHIQWNAFNYILSGKLINFYENVCWTCCFVNKRLSNCSRQCDVITTPFAWKCVKYVRCRAVTNQFIALQKKVLKSNFLFRLFI